MKITTDALIDALPNPYRVSGQQLSYDGFGKAHCDLYCKEQMIEFAGTALAMARAIEAAHNAKLPAPVQAVEPRK